MSDAKTDHGFIFVLSNMDIGGYITLVDFPISNTIYETCGAIGIASLIIILLTVFKNK